MELRSHRGGNNQNNVETVVFLYLGTEEWDDLGDQKSNGILIYSKHLRGRESGVHKTPATKQRCCVRYVSLLSTNGKCKIGVFSLKDRGNALFHLFSAYAASISINLVPSTEAQIASVRRTDE